MKFHAAHRVLIFRDDVKIDVATGGATCYVDRFDLKRGRRCWYIISAYDQMSLESPRTADIAISVSPGTDTALPRDPEGLQRVHPTNPR